PLAKTSSTHATSRTSSWPKRSSESVSTRPADTRAGWARCPRSCERSARRSWRRRSTGKRRTRSPRLRRNESHLALRIGVLTGGGYAPGLNAAIRAVVLRATALWHEVLGITEGWAGAVGE